MMSLTMYNQLQRRANNCQHQHATVTPLYHREHAYLHCNMLQTTPYLPLPCERSPDGATWTADIWFSSLLIYRLRKDERLSWPSWLTYSGRCTHISGHTGPPFCGTSPVPEPSYSSAQYWNKYFCVKPPAQRLNVDTDQYVAERILRAVVVQELDHVRWRSVREECRDLLVQTSASDVSRSSTNLWSEHQTTGGLLNCPPASTINILPSLSVNLQ